MLTRRFTQMAGTLVANPWFVYLWTRTIYQGKLKGICFPGFNCYACPLAAFSCPIGALQHSMVMVRDRVTGAFTTSWMSAVSAFLYVIGFIGIIGALTGRLVCGWICPFGFLQDLLYKVPSRKFRMPPWFRYGKYFFLGVVAMMIPLLTGRHWFSRLCPAGALEGAIPLRALPPEIQLPTAGWFFWFKIGILVLFLAWMVVTKRPFCRAVCPLGAAYALLNPVSVYRMRVDGEACNQCGVCREVCPVDINIFEDPNSPECIRCLDCKKACPRGAITSGFRAATRAGSSPVGTSRSSAEE